VLLRMGSFYWCLQIDWLFAVFSILLLSYHWVYFTYFSLLKFPFSFLYPVFSETVVSRISNCLLKHFYFIIIFNCTMGFHWHFHTCMTFLVPQSIPTSLMHPLLFLFSP
jgi:hypothetical protein